MLLKMLLMLLSLGFFFSDTGGGSAGDDDGGGDDDSGDDGAGGEDGGDDDESSDDDGGDDRAELKAALDKERKARRDAVKAQKALQRELDALKAGDGDGDSDKLTAAEQRAEAAERRLREATGRSAVMDAANEANAIDLDVVYAMVRDELEYDDAGEPTNVEDVLEELQERKPKLFRHSKGRGDGGAGGDTKVEVLPGVDRIRHAYEQNAKKQKAGRR